MRGFFWIYTRLILLDIVFKILFLLGRSFWVSSYDLFFSVITYFAFIEVFFYCIPFLLLVFLYLNLIDKIFSRFGYRDIVLLVVSFAYSIVIFLSIFLVLFKNSWPVFQVGMFFGNALVVGGGLFWLIRKRLNPAEEAPVAEEAPEASADEATDSDEEKK